MALTFFPGFSLVPFADALIFLTFKSSKTTTAWLLQIVLETLCRKSFLIRAILERILWTFSFCFCQLLENFFFLDTHRCAIATFRFALSNARIGSINVPSEIVAKLTTPARLIYMPRMLLIPIFLTALAALFQLESEASKFRNTVTSKGPVLRVSCDVTKGSIIKADSVFEGPPSKSSLCSKFVNSRVHGCDIGVLEVQPDISINKSVAVGRKSRYGLKKGDVVSVYDLDPYPADLVGPAVFVYRNISKGSIIRREALADVFVIKPNIPKGAILSAAKAVGKKASNDISRGSYIISDDICASR